MTRIQPTHLILAAAALLLVAGPVIASNEIAENTGEVCTACHDKPGSKLLTDQGKYYETMRSLEGYEQIEAAFGRCVTCHSRKPGSEKLTKTGKRYQWMMNDMEGLRDFVMQRHPDVQLVDPEDGTKMPMPEEEGAAEPEAQDEEGSSPDR
jgi:cytochrome c553